jgi:hypothetical protein
MIRDFEIRQVEEGKELRFKSHFSATQYGWPCWVTTRNSWDRRPCAQIRLRHITLPTVPLGGDWYSPRAFVLQSLAKSASPSSALGNFCPTKNPSPCHNSYRTEHSQAGPANTRGRLPTIRSTFMYNTHGTLRGSIQIQCSLHSLSTK